MFSSVLEVPDLITLQVPDPINLQVSNPITLPLYAIPVKVSPVAFANTPNIDTVISALQGDIGTTTSHLHQFSVVSRDQAALEVDISEGYVVFNNVSARVQALGYSRMPYRVKIEETKMIRSILQAASHFDRFLNLMPAKRLPRDCIEVEFLEITRPEDRVFGPGIQRGNAQNLCTGDLVEVKAGETPYGIKITNKSTYQLYAYLFLFDCSDLSIGKYRPICLQSVVTDLFSESYYTPPLVMTAEDKDAPLPANGGILTIGYGTGGEQPWSHYVRDEDTLQNGKVLQDEQDLDVGVFKLFLTTKYVDLSCIEQMSPFLGNERAAKKLGWGKGDHWDTVSLFVSVRR
jgi:hypothetical protein